MTDLLKWLKPGATVYTILRHVSRSGTYREISVMIARPDKKDPNGVRLIFPDYAVATVLSCKLAKYDGIKISGGGMDMGFHLIYSLGRALWPDGTAKPHGMRNGKPDRDGGYALKHKWL